MKYVLLVLSMFLSINSSASSFNKKHYMVAKDIIWAADKVEIPRVILLAICWGESNFRQDDKVTHIDGETPSYGVCQVKLETAQWMDKVYKHKILASPERLENPAVNAFYAAKYLKMLLKNYEGDWQLTVDAYNKGTAVSSQTKYVKRFHNSVKLIIEKIPEANETLQN